MYISASNHIHNFFPLADPVTWGGNGLLANGLSQNHCENLSNIWHLGHFIELEALSQLFDLSVRKYSEIQEPFKLYFSSISQN